MGHRKRQSTEECEKKVPDTFFLRFVTHVPGCSHDHSVIWGHHTYFWISLRIVFFTEKGLLWAIAPLDKMVGELRYPVPGNAYSCLVPAGVAPDNPPPRGDKGHDGREHDCSQRDHPEHHGNVLWVVGFPRRRLQR